MARQQTEKDIKSLHGLESVRMKPAMYIGHIDSYGLWTIFRELADNTVDEFLAGRNKLCHLIYDGTACWCIDAGEGVPVGNIKFKAHNHMITMPAIVAIFSQLHTGGKLEAGGKAYDVSRGTHGVGSKATNALSTEFRVWTKRDSTWHTVAFSKGELTEDLSTAKRAPVLPFGIKAPSSGTIIKFVPDMSIFEKRSKLKPTDVFQWCELTSYLNGGLTLKFTDPNGKTKEWFSKNGASDYLANLITTNGANDLGKPCVLTTKSYDLAIAFTDYDGTDFRGFTNGLLNADGGVHVNSFYAALSKVLLQYKGARQTFTGVDLREGLLGLINYKISSPAFNSQTKERLIDERVTEPCTASLTDELTTFFNSNKALAKRICERIDQLRALKNEFANNKRVLKELKTSGRKSILPTKLVASIGSKPADRELFLVEGDSAGGSAAKARDKSYQEMLPLKGKILNVYKAVSSKVFDSEEVINILKSIGYDPSKPNPMEHLRVGRIVLLGDADPDGGHVNTLNLCLLAKYMPALFTEGMVYVAKGAEYVIETDDRNYYAGSPDEMRKLVPNQALMKRLLHLKGWAELSAKGLHELAFNPKTRIITKISMPTKKDFKLFESLMGEDVAYRRKWLGI